MTICKPVSPKLCSTIILAGGASKRMGRDKATLPWNGKTLLEDLVQRFHQYSSKILVVAAIQQKIPPLPEHVHLVHDASAFPGPLWGLYYGLRAVMHSGPVFVTGCDYPLLPAELPAFLMQHYEESSACLFQHHGQIQPFPGLYSTGVIRILEKLLSEGATSMRALLAQCPHTVISEQIWQKQLPEDVFLNMNTPEDYELALNRWLTSKA